MPQKLLSFVLFFLTVATAAGQTPTPAKPAEDAAKLEKDAIELLRETSVEVGRLRTLENRISFNSELASLMWFHDDKEAKAMYGQVVAEFKQLLSQFDSQMNSLEVPDEESMGGIFGNYGKSKVERKFQIAMAVRQQIAMSLADHAPDLAYNFFIDSLNSVTNPKLRAQAEANKSFETQLMQRIAESDAKKAAEYGKESIKGGVQSHHVELLKKIYSKDVDRGIDFGAAILSQLKFASKSDKAPYVMVELLSFADSNLEASKKQGGKKPVYSFSEVRDIAEMLAGTILDGDEHAGYSVFGSMDEIEKYAPGRAAQLRTKFAKLGLGDDAPPPPKAANTVAYSNTNTPYAANSNTAPSRANEEREAREKREKQLMDDIKNLGSKPASKEERDKVIAQSRKVISSTPGKDKKIVALSLLAAQVARAGDKELAGEIMRDAERLVNPQPKNFQDFLLQLMLANGYAEVDPDKAFPILEVLILRNNELTSAILKVAEFIDVNSEIIDDGEVQVGMFGGDMIRSMTGELGVANGTIRTLAKADFVKTRNLTNTFDRTETRVLAKMLVLRSVLDKKHAEKSEDELLKELDSIK